MTSATTRRTVLFGMVLAATACDLAQFAIDPKPRFEETWNMPGPNTRMSVADLLPSGNTVTIKSDSSAFQVKMDSTTLSAVLGPNCAACVPLNGTNAPKPAFTMTPGNSTTLPADIVSAVITSGQIQLKLKNGLSFDPLYVKTGPGAQGFLRIVVSSGTQVLGQDSVSGASDTTLANQSGCASMPSQKCNVQFAPGVTLTRNINLLTATVTGNIKVDVTVNSPVGDHLVPIQTATSFTATASVPTMDVASVQMNIPSRTFDSGAKDSLEMPATGDFVVGLGLDMTITNPFAAVAGSNLNMIFAWGTGGPGSSITKTVTLPSGTALRTVTLDSAETQQLLNAPGKVAIKIQGTVSASSPITVTPKQEVAIANRFRLKIRTGSGEEK